MPGSSDVKTTSFNLRLILWEAGITVSNKVLECLILRFMKNKFLCSEAYVIVMIRLHLAHGKNEITLHISKQISVKKIQIFKLRKWYFVTKIVLTYCEKKIVLVIEKNF